MTMSTRRPPLAGLADARGALPVPPAAYESKRRSLTCWECDRPVGAGRVRHPACLTAARRRAETEGVNR